MARADADSSRAETRAPVLLCFDGSDDAAWAIRAAGLLLAPAPAFVLSVWLPVAVWEPYDPGTILSAPFERVASNALQLDEISEGLARQHADRGVEIATAAGFDAQARIASGRPRVLICDVAAELGAGVIVLGSRGLGRISGALLGSVSSAVAVRAHRPVLIVPAVGSGG